MHVSARAAVTSSPDRSGRGSTEPTTPAAEAERRLVTVLFTDLVGFTTLAEDRDPEAVRELLSTYFDTATRIVELHGGIVEKFIGDAVMAVWGTPVAHEDDAERAVRAALELVDAVKALHPDLQARAGVLTGEAAVTLERDEPGHGRRRPREHRRPAPGRRRARARCWSARPLDARPRARSCSSRSATTR